MISYLEKQQNRCSWKDIYFIKQVFESFIFDSFQDILPPNKRDFDIENVNEDISYHFITFNYTNLIDKIVSLCRLNDSNIIREGLNPFFNTYIQSIHHVHGELASQIIMGVNDVSQLNINPRTTVTRALKRQLIKPSMNSGLNHNWDTPAIQTIHNSNIVAIYGVSYGQTDNFWWQEIGSWLEKSQEHRLVSFERNFEKSPTFRLASEQVAYYDEKREKLLGKFGFTEDDSLYEQLLSQIYIIENTKRLNLKPIILNDTPKETVLDKVAISEVASAAEMV